MLTVSTDDYIVAWNDQYADFDLGGRPALAGHPITVAPQSTSDAYVLVMVKVVGPVSANATGCTVLYESRSQVYRQTLDCTFRLTFD